MGTILMNFALQLFCFVGIVAIVGFLIFLLNKLFYFVITGDRIVCYATGVIGTPVHELSHALACVIFFHHIEEIKLFQIDDETGTLGYVKHSYNKRNVYQMIGNFFIGVAPILCGTAIIYLLIRFMLPTAYAEIAQELSGMSALQRAGDYSAWFLQILLLPWQMFKAVFGAFSAGFLWWIFFLVAFCLSLHMNLSGADIKGALMGLPFVIGFLFALNLALGFLPVYGGFTSFMNAAGGYLAGTLLLSLVFSLIAVAIGAVGRGIVFGVSRLKNLRK